MESDDEFDLLPVKRRGPAVAKVNSLDASPNNFVKVTGTGATGLNGIGDDDHDLPVKRREPSLTNNGFGDDPFSNFSGTKLPPDVKILNDSDMGMKTNVGLYNNHTDNSKNGLLWNDSDEEHNAPPPVRRRGAPTPTIPNGESFVRHRGMTQPPATSMGSDDPFDNISMRIHQIESVNLSGNDGDPDLNMKPAGSGELSEVLQNEMLFNNLINDFDKFGLDKDKGVGNTPDSDVNVASAGSVEDEFFLCQEPATRKNKGVSFDLKANDQINSGFTEKNLSVSNKGMGKQQFGDNFDEGFQPVETSNFIEGLDFLEQCGNDDAVENIQRKSLYVKFDPFCDVKQPDTTGNDQVSTGKQLNSTTNDQISRQPIYNIETVEASLPCYPQLMSSSVMEDPFSPLKQSDPFSPMKQVVPSKAESSTKELNPQTKPDLDTIGLVEPLLYTQSDMDEVVKKAKCDLDDDVNARELDWKKKYEELECKIKEEVAMRELIEQDYRGKMDCLRKDNVDMKQVLSQYERTIVELTENTHIDNKSNEETLAETIRAKEQLQEDLNSAEQNLFDAYKRIEKLKQTIDTYKQNEQILKENSSEVNTKLQKSEDRYTKLREHATEKIDSANALIGRVRKQQEVDMAGLQAALKIAQNRVHNLELEITQKNLENQQLSQICDDLIKKVSGD